MTSLSTKLPIFYCLLEVGRGVAYIITTRAYGVREVKRNRLSSQRLRHLRAALQEGCTSTSDYSLLGKVSIIATQ